MKGKIFNAQEVQAIIAENKTIFREVIKTCKQHPKSLCKKTRRAHYGIDFTENGLFWRPYGGSELQPFPYCDGKLSASNSLDEFCPYKVGQKIFVKERFFEEIHPDSLRKNGKIHYDASCDYEVIKVDGDGFQIFYKDGTPASPWKSPVHMKQEHSRLTLEITDIKVERLDDISEEDAIKEGVNKLFTEEEMKHVLRVHQIEKNNTYKNYLWHGHIGRIITKKQSDEWEYQCSAYEKAKDSFFSLWNATHKKPEEKFEANPFVWVVDFKIIN